MEQREITTKGFQDKVLKIAKSFIDFVNSKKEYHDNNIELMLLLNKINTNIQGATLLASYGMFSESKIILRSAFETLVLFEYLSNFPDKIEQYKEDNIIAEIQIVFGFYKRGYATYEKLVEVYDKLTSDLKTKIPFKQESEHGVISYNTELLEKYFKGYRDGFKPLSQKVLFMLEELNKINSFNAKYLSEYQIMLYNINSQVAHSRLDTLLLSVKNLSNNEEKEELQWCFRHSVCLLFPIIKYLEAKQNYECPRELWEYIFDTMKYLDFNIQELKQQESKENLIDIIKFFN